MRLMAIDLPVSQHQMDGELPPLLGGFFGSEGPGAGGLTEFWQVDPGLC